MARDYYYLKEVLLGLRGEYLKYEEAMGKLNSYIICKDKRVKDFYLFLTIEKEFWLELDLKKRRSIIDRMMRIYSVDNIGRIIKDSSTGEIELETNGYQMGLNSSFMDEMNQEMESIIQSDFVKNIHFYQLENNFYLEFRFFGFIVKDFHHYFNYCVRNSEFLQIGRCGKGGKLITNDLVWDVLDTKMSRNYFSEYHQNLIEENGRNFQDIKIKGNVFGFRTVEMGIREEDNLVLYQKKRIRK